MRTSGRCHTTCTESCEPQDVVIQHVLSHANLRPQRPRRTAAAASGGAAECACRRPWALTRFLGAGGHRCSGTCDVLARVMLLRAGSDSGGVV